MNDISNKKQGIVKKPKAVEMETKIDRKGYVTLSFDQSMQIPKFGKRRLGESNETLGLSNIDVSRDMLNLDFILKSETNPRDVKYSLELKEWSSKKVGIQVNFTDPLSIS